MNCEGDFDYRRGVTHLTGKIDADQCQRCQRCGIVIVDAQGNFFPEIKEARKCSAENRGPHKRNDIGSLSKDGSIDFW